MRRQPIPATIFTLSVLAIAVSSTTGCDTEAGHAPTSSMRTGDIGGGHDQPASVAHGEANLAAERPDALLVEPLGYDPESRDYPLIVFLHSYAGGAVEQAWYLHLLQLQASTQDFLLLLPSGAVDAAGNTFWEATDTCCDHDAVQPGDADWLAGQIDRVVSEHPVSRVGLFGASNGGFMAHAMACQHADRVDAVASFAGMTFEDATLCDPSQPVSMLHIHGTSDDVVFFDGLHDESGPAPLTGGYPGAEETVARWVAYDRCDDESTELAPIDVETSLEGAETAREAWSCPEAAVELWTVHGGGHRLEVDLDFAAEVVHWLTIS
jgi:polyhydroxybutyrate depolymerase